MRGAIKLSLLKRVVYRVVKYLHTYLFYKNLIYLGYTKSFFSFKNNDLTIYAPL